MDKSRCRTGEIVAKLRAEVGLNQSSFARALAKAGMGNATQTWVARVESGSSPLKLSDAAIVARILGCKLEDLLDSAERPPTPDRVRVGIEMSIRTLTELLEAQTGQPSDL